MRTLEEEQIVPLAALALALPMELLPSELDAQRPAAKSSFVRLAPQEGASDAELETESSY